MIAVKKYKVLMFTLTKSISNKANSIKSETNRSFLDIFIAIFVLYLNLINKDY